MFHLYLADVAKIDYKKLEKKAKTELKKLEKSYANNDKTTNKGSK
jgi:hypothetical protein